jgi:hypothetical protein
LGDSLEEGVVEVGDHGVGRLRGEVVVLVPIFLDLDLVAITVLLADLH